MSKLIFGGSKPWPTFTAVDDSIRGGKSTSHWEVGSDNIAKFSGNLDITALGGAGFASRSSTFSPRLSFSPSRTAGLLLTFVPPTLPTPSTRDMLSVLPPHTPHRYTLNLKNDEPPHRPDGRRESVTVYEWELDVRDYEPYVPRGVKEVDEEKGEKGSGEVTVLARWEDFKATYRGKDKLDARPLDPSSIYELSFMCRSNFGNQAGDFALDIVSLAEAPRDGRLRQWLALVLQLMHAWKEWLARLLGRRDGAVRLP
ncbi:hypothetical protein JCM10207_003800 [Rhodosporidiobolus poonsookiae]